MMSRVRDCDVLYSVRAAASSLTMCLVWKARRTRQPPVPYRTVVYWPVLDCAGLCWTVR